MLVRATKTGGDYYKIKKDESYIVYGMCLVSSPYKSGAKEVDDTLEGYVRNFFDPKYSYGVSRNELVYYIECDTDGRGKVLARFNAANFLIDDTTIPADWLSASFDITQKAVEVAELLKERLPEVSGRIFNNTRDINGQQNSFYVTGFPELTEYDFFLAASDDNMSDEYEEIFLKYKNRYLVKPKS